MAIGEEVIQEERSLPIELEHFEEAIDFLRFLGWDKGVVIVTDTFIFDYKGTEFALVRNKDFNYFEAEKIIKNEKDIDKTHKDIMELCKESDLKPFTEDEFMNKINLLNNIKENQFDFSKQNFSKFKQKFKEYF